jgi:hypothetical protein
VEEGFEAGLKRKHSPASARPRIFDGAAEAKLIALACSEPPKGRKRWTLKLLEAAVVELSIVERASDNTIGRVLKKDILKPHLQTGHPDGSVKSGDASDAGCGTCLAVFGFPHGHQQLMVDGLPSSLGAPAVEIPLHGREGGKVTRQQVPLTAGFGI